MIRKPGCQSKSTTSHLITQTMIYDSRVHKLRYVN